MRKTKRASSGIGHNGDLAPHEVWLKALAVEILYQEQKKQLRELHKRARKTLEGKGVTLAELDALYKRREDSPEEIEALFRRLFNAFGAVHTEITQYDLFTVKADAPAKAAHRMNGQMSALAGEPCQPPSGLVGEPLQEWTEGWHEGEETRKAGLKTLADTLAEALAEAEKGNVVDGTGNKPGTLSDHEAAGLKVVERAEGKAKKSGKAKREAVRLVAGTDVEPGVGVTAAEGTEVVIASDESPEFNEVGVTVRDENGVLVQGADEEAREPELTI